MQNAKTEAMSPIGMFVTPTASPPGQITAMLSRSITTFARQFDPAKRYFTEWKIWHSNGIQSDPHCFPVLCQENGCVQCHYRQSWHLLKALAIFCIPLVAGINSIWIAPFIAETITLLIAVILKKTNKLVYQ